MFWNASTPLPYPAARPSVEAVTWRGLSQIRQFVNSCYGTVNGARIHSTTASASSPPVYVSEQRQTNPRVEHSDDTEAAG